MSEEISMRLGDHADGFDPIPDGELGTRDNPYRVAPPDWEEGLPYGAFCRCSRCNELGRSTVAFDFYAKTAGDPLVCETCSRADWGHR